jgi:hypothetical protein
VWHLKKDHSLLKPLSAKHRPVAGNCDSQIVEKIARAEQNNQAIKQTNKQTNKHYSSEILEWKYLQLYFP